ncbi:hypothetical protein [Agromyces binzhouensis]|uniref:Uncharacterized protein n=1 Tax=Agromyces binzhouensis TaxID=1817495 RepID=A0A4Q2JN44_9MICO|nr:hypothetical protein [Agromyces binzhouensis]RXZ48216.1 hypothetical protein ESO86_07620 [Agromyces binzhouensis]
MNEKPIKVDAATDRTVSELAYFLRTTKKAVVAIAVAEYSEQRDRYLAAPATSGGSGEGEFGPEDGGGEHGAPGDHGTGDTRASARPTVLDLAPLQRLALRRTELVRAFATHGAGGIRLLDTAPAAPGEAGLVLLAETDIVEGGQAAWDLSRVASQLLGLRVEVISTTMLRLFDKPRLRRALEQSRPL